MQNVLNNREWAILLWAGAFLLWAIRRDRARRSLRALLKSLLHPKLSVWIVFGVAYTICEVLALHEAGLWTVAQAKDTVIWFLFTGIRTAFGLIGSWKGDNLFKVFAGDSLKITIVLEFLADEYTMPIAAELVLVPFLVFLGGMTAVADHYPEHARVKPLLGWLQALAGILILTVAFHGALSDWQRLESLDALRQLALAPLLSILFVPFGYAVLLFTTYENTLVRLRFAFRNEPDLHRYARTQLIRRFGLNVHALLAWSDVAIRRLWQLRSEADVDRLLATSADDLRCQQSTET